MSYGSPKKKPIKKSKPKKKAQRPQKVTVRRRR